MKKLITLMVLFLSGFGIATASAQTPTTADTVSTSIVSKPKAKAAKHSFFRKIEIQAPVPGDPQSLILWTADKFNSDFNERMNRRVAQVTQGNWWEPNDSLFSSFTFNFAPFTANLHGIGYDF